MKKIITLLITVSAAIQLHAQHDSIAVSQLSELGVYYFSCDSLIKIEPIVQEGMSSGVNPFSVRTSMVYEGEKSENIFSTTPTFYIFVPKMYQRQINVKQFRLITLTAKKGKRKLNTGSVSMFGGRVGAKGKTLNMEKLSDECYKVFSTEDFDEGHYGVFYNYGTNIPLKLYDFDIIRQ
jgi:hypothetical protein